MKRSTKKRDAPSKSEATRARILEAALALFRKRGFAETTMRDIAQAAGLAQGAAYYYFDSKEVILFAYYARNQAEHEARRDADGHAGAPNGRRGRMFRHERAFGHCGRNERSSPPTQVNVA